MKLESVTDVIAVRKFRMLGESSRGEPVREVLLKLGKPQLSPDSPVVEEHYLPIPNNGHRRRARKVCCGSGRLSGDTTQFKTESVVNCPGCNKR